MDVDAAKRRNIQYPLGQELAVSHNDDQIGRAASQLFHRLFGPDALRLKDGDIMLHGQFLDRRRQQLITSALGFIRLGKNAGHRIARVQQLLQAGHRELRRTHKHDVQSGLSFYFVLT